MTHATIPNHIRQSVLLEAGYKCASPVCRHILTLDLHHIVWVKDGGENDPVNFVALCPNCHALHTRGHIPEQAIRAWKSILVALKSTNHAAADLLLLLASDEKRIAAAEDPTKVTAPFRFTGGGLPALSGLIVSGLVAISKRYSGVNAWGSSMPSFEVSLTPRGRSLVAAWLDGKADLSGPLEQGSET